MNAEQLELQPRPAPRIVAEEVAALIEELRGQGWRTATELGAKTEEAKRLLRAIAEASGARIVSGAKGYRLLEEMSVEEYGKCRGRLRAMARGILRRMVALDRAYHSGRAAGSEVQS